MRVLITGANGQLGLALQIALRAHDVAALGHAQLDITDADAVRTRHSRAIRRVVIHCAAWTDTTGCERDPERAMLVNGEGARNVAAACREIGAAMVYVSSNEVFDGEKGAPYVEDDAPNPINSYGRSKLAGEIAVRETLDRALHRADELGVRPRPRRASRRRSCQRGGEPAKLRVRHRRDRLADLDE